MLFRPESCGDGENHAMLAARLVMPTRPRARMTYSTAERIWLPA